MFPNIFTYFQIMCLIDYQTQECLYNAPRNPDLLIRIRISFYKIIGYKIF